MATNNIGGPKTQNPTQAPVVLDDDKPASSKPSAEKIAAGALTKATPKMAGVMTSTMEKNPVPTAPAVPVVAPQAAVAQLNTPEALLRHLQAFSTLAAGLAAPPSGATVAERFAAEFSFSDAAPLTTFVPGSLFSALATQSTLPKDRAARANAIARMLAKHEPAAAAKQFSTLTSPQQAAVRHLSALIKPLYKAQVTSVLQRRLAPAERRAILAGQQQQSGVLGTLFGSSTVVDQVSGRSDDQAHGHADGDGLSAMQSYQQSGALGPITIPGPQMTALENSASAVFKAGLGMDIDGLVQMTLMESSELEDKELMELINDTREQNRKMAKMRDVIAAQKKNLEDVKAQLRQAYDARTRLDQGDALYIDPASLSFDSFCQSQKLKVNGSMTTPTEDLLKDGADINEPSYGVSPNVEFYASTLRATISDQDIAWARALGITPQQLQELHGTYDDSSEYAAECGDFATFLATKVGLLAPPVAETDPAAQAREWLAEFSPRAIMGRVGADYNLNPGQVAGLYEFYKSNTTTEERRDGFEKWLEHSSLGLVKGARGTDNQAKIDGYLRESGVAANHAALMSTYGLSAADLDFLREYHATLDDAPDFERWVVSPDGPRLREGESNHEAVRAWASARATATQEAGSAVPFPITANGHSFTDLNDALNWIASQSATTNPDTNTARIDDVKKTLDAITAAFGFPKGGLLEQLMKQYMSALCADNAHDLNSESTTALNSLRDFIGNLPEDEQEKANALMSMRMGQVSNELSYDLGRDDLWSRNGQDGGFIYHGTRGVEGEQPHLAGHNAYQWLNASDALAMKTGFDNAQRNFAGYARVIAERQGPGRQHAAEQNRIAHDYLRNEIETRALPFPWPASGAPTPAPANLAEPLSDAEAAELQHLEALRNLNGFDALDGTLADDSGLFGSLGGPDPFGILGRAANTAGYDPQRYWDLRHRYAEHGPPMHLVTARRAEVAVMETREARTEREAREARQQSTIEALRNVDTTPEDAAAAAGRVTGFTEITLGQLNAHLEELVGKKETFSSLSEEMSLKLQMHMDRRAKLIQTLSNVMKKIADVQSGIIGNLK